MRTFLIFILSISFVELGFLFLEEKPLKNEFFSLNRLCKSISFNQAQKNDCLITAGFQHSPKNKTIKIAVLDSGIDRNHYFLNQYVSNQGYDISFSKTYDPFLDKLGHGTHVAGIIVQQVEELSDKFKIVIPIEITSAKFTDDETYQVSSFKNLLGMLVESQKFDIINISASGPEPDKDEFETLFKSLQNETQIVVAAGNEKINLNEKFSSFPCAYSLPNIICVANSENDFLMNSSSSYGSYFVDIMADGTNILSTAPHDSWAVMSGTSMATPRITALMALLKVMEDRPYFDKKEFSRLSQRTPAFYQKSRFGHLDFSNLKIGSSNFRIGYNHEK